jgi:integrase
VAFVPLVSVTADDTFSPETPEKRKRGKCMSRRFQTGSIETSGKWVVVRFWKDVAGQEKRIHACERICPSSGPDKLNNTEIQRKAQEVLAAAGVNNPQQFIEATVAVTFREQAKTFLQQKTMSKRRPIKPATLCSWQNCVDKWLNPNLGDSPLSSINNAAMKLLVAKMHKAGLSPKSILNYTGLVKLVVASAKSDEGEQLFPRKWDSEFMDLPIVKEQRQPTFTADTVSAIVKNAVGQERMLYALLAGAGLRVGEALGLELQHISGDFRTVYVRQSVWEGMKQDPKTQAAIRDIDLCSSLAEMLQQFIGERRTGFLFVNRSGRALAQSNVLRRSLHPLLKELKTEKAGFHSFRRFRTTHLRKNRVPEDLLRFWIGHADKTITDTYCKVQEDTAFRLEVADKVGLGFVLENPIVRNVRRKENEVEVAVAA